MSYGLRVSILLILAAVFSGCPAYAFDSGLIYHWNFDEGPDWHEDPFGSVCLSTVAFDSLGQADLTLQNMDSADWVSGVQFTCLEFDGVDDSLLASADLSAVLGNTSTLAYWMRTTSTSLAGITGSDEIQWGRIDEQGKVALAIDGQILVRSDTPVNDGNWHHVAIRYDAAGTASIYVDGELSASASGTAGVKTAAFYSIGTVEGNTEAAGYFSGRIDQIHVFDYVIDQATVVELMDNHAPKTWEVTTQGTNTQPFSTASVFFNSYDPEQDELSVVSFTQGDNGTVADNGDGSFTYTADSGFVGYDSFDVVIEDGKGGFTHSTVTVSVVGDPGSEGADRTTTFTDFQAIQAGGVNISLSGMRVPRVIDWDNDGDNDLLVGHSGTVWRYMNTGTPSNPVFAAGVRVVANGANISLSGTVLIALADMTGDEVDDLVAVAGDRKVRVYRNMSLAGEVPVYAASYFVKMPNNSDFVLPDQRFDAGDWDGDGLNDIIMGNRSGEVRAYLNVGTTATPELDSSVYEVLSSGSYNLYPRLFDISRNGVPDYIQGINWGSISYWFDPQLNSGLSSGGTLVVMDSVGAVVDMKAATDGAMVDFADFNGDGVYDLVTGGYAGSPNIFLAYGQAKTVGDCIAQNEAIYDAHPGDLGTALEANGQELLGVINANSRAIISHMQAATLPEREQMFADMTAHVGRYSFLQMGSSLNTSVYHHVPSIAGQNLMTMHQMLPDTPTHRANVADAVGLTGGLRDIYITTFLHVGENQTSSLGQRESVLEYINSLPREIFPDSLLTLGNYWGDGRGGTVNSFRGAKNTFSSNTGGDSGDGFSSDQDGPIEAVFGTGAYKGDYFTLVMGHEVTHSLDGYVRRCANKDLWRRKGLMLVHAGGPDIVAGSNGWVDWNATKAHFQAQGYWDGVSANWNAAWSDYWSTGPGSAWRKLSFMRGHINIDWFYGAPQEALATQANQSLSHSEGRLVAAIDRWRRGVENGIAPMKANINECIDFLDYVSAGLNKVVLYDTRGVQTPYRRADYTITRAWLRRNDQGFITSLRVGPHEYHFEVDADGIITDVNTNILTVDDDSFAVFKGKANILDVLANDRKLEGTKPVILSFTQPKKGQVINNGDGTLVFMPSGSASGTDSFTYTAADVNGTGSLTAIVNMTILDRQGILQETFLGISGTAVSNLTGSSKYPNNPDEIEVVNSFETDTNVTNYYGTKMSGWLEPPVTGEYIFWIASDDSSQLKLSSDTDPANAEIIAYVSGYTSFKQWTKYTSQTSVAITLQAGQSYYIEALHKEGSGSDHLAVAWQGPGFSQVVISGAYVVASYIDAPVFIANPIVRAAALEGIDYLGTIANSVFDNDGVTFSKEAGSAWLQVAVDGSLSGIAGNDDVGDNSFTIRASNVNGAYSDAVLNLTVHNTFTGELGHFDLAGLAAQWLASGCVDTPLCGGADLTGDGSVDIDDVKVFGGFWLVDYDYRWLVSHWPFDVDDTDLVGNNQATLKNGAHITTAAGDVKIGAGAVSLDGVDDYVSADGISADVAGSDFTIAMWIKANMADSNKFFASFNAANGDNRLMLGQQSSNDLLYVYDNGWHGSSAVVFDGTWHYVALALADSQDQLHLYVDGELVLSYATANSIAADDMFSLGQEYDAGLVPSDFLNGQLDDVRVYMRLLSEDEISQLMN